MPNLLVGRFTVGGMACNLGAVALGLTSGVCSPVRRDLEVKTVLAVLGGVPAAAAGVRGVPSGQDRAVLGALPKLCPGEGQLGEKKNMLNV